MTEITLKLSGIVPAHNAETTIEDFLRALIVQDGYLFGQDYEIILVDDGSTGQKAQIAMDFGVQVNRQRNAGSAAARNAGVENAKGDLIFFMDSDCIPTSDWLFQITTPFQGSSVMGVKGLTCEVKIPDCKFCSTGVCVYTSRFSQGSLDRLHRHLLGSLP